MEEDHWANVEFLMIFVLYIFGFLTLSSHDRIENNTDDIKNSIDMLKIMISTLNCTCT